jgi:hypothetical protein
LSSDHGTRRGWLPGSLLSTCRPSWRHRGARPPTPRTASPHAGGFWIRWHDPTDARATIWKVEWDPAEGGSEEEVWQAVEILAGGPVPR